MLAVTALAVAACSSGTGSGGKSSSKTVTVYTGFSGDQATRFADMIAPFEKQTGIKVTHVDIANVQTALTTRVAAGNPPDIALIPQPGLVNGYAAQGKIQPLDGVVDVSKLKSELVPGLADTTTVNGKLYAIPVDVSVKSLVWYPPAAFQKDGYQVPQTLEQFQQLVDKMRSDGNTPLCLGVESGTGTGWAATDWFEDLVLRTAGPQVYDQWINHTVKFDSPQIKRVADMFAKLAFTDGNVPGGRKGIVSTKWSDSILPMFNAGKPGCMMEKMGSFLANSLPKTVKPGTDVNVFYFPALASGGYQGKPVEGAGDLATLFTTNPAAKKLMQYLASPDAGKPWASQGGFLSPFKGFDSSIYPDQLTKTEAQILDSATAFRFDASDAMPAAVGTGSFFKEMTSWINGSESEDQALKNIDASWPSS